MRHIITASLILIPSIGLAAAQQQRPEQPAPQGAQAAPENRCDPMEPRFADQTGEVPRAQRLDTLPGANLHLAVQREVDGCIEPVVVRQDIGGAAPEPQRRDARRDWQAPAAKGL